MTDPHVRRLNAEQVLRRPSSQEALDLDEQVPYDATSLRAHGVPSHECKDQHALSLWWQRHVRVTTQHEHCRDHFGMLPYILSLQPSLILMISKRKDSPGIFQDRSSLRDAWCCYSPAYAPTEVAKSRPSSGLLRCVHSPVFYVSSAGSAHFISWLLSLFPMAEYLETRPGHFGWVGDSLIIFP